MPAAAGPRPERATLLFFTESYPYELAREQTFVGPQLRHLQAAFERVVLIPSWRGGACHDTPGGIEVDESLAERLVGGRTRLETVARASRSRLLWDDLMERPWIAQNPSALKRLVALAGRAATTRDWLERRLRLRQWVAASTTAYAFWCDHTATAMSLTKMTFPELVCVARVNGADLFEERHDPPYLPCRRTTLAGLDRVYAVSEHGRRYLADRYPSIAQQSEVARLGVADPGFLSPSSPPGHAVIVSCSGIVPVKRVDLIADGVTCAGRLRPGLELEWHHFGDGPSVDTVRRHAEEALPGNVTARFHGQRPIEEIIWFYRTHPVDIFVNASDSEGGAPVAIMEAASCGIPIVATAVGGNPEIVSERNGILVSAHPGPEEIAHAVLTLVEDPQAAATKRHESRAVWEERFVADANFADFADRLRGLRSAR